MAQFKFKLQGVLRQRELVEDEKQRALSIVRAEMSGLESQLRNLNQTVIDATNDLKTNRLTGVLDMKFLAAHRRFMIATQRQGMEIVQKMANVQKKLEAAQKELLEATKQRKAIEKLKEKQQE